MLFLLKILFSFIFLNYAYIFIGGILMNNKDYTRLSIELHLFFDRIMKEHSLFIEASAVDNEIKNIANNFKNIFDDILNKIVDLSDNGITNNYLKANIIVTDNTLAAEEITSTLTNINILKNTTIKELQLKSGSKNININDIAKINEQTLLIVEDLIKFKQNILDKVLKGETYTFSYPLLIDHMIEEAKMYHDLLLKVQNKETVLSNFVFEQDMFWNTIMKEHAMFLRGLLDPTEQKLINEANNYAIIYNNIINNTDLSKLTSESIIRTDMFKKFNEEIYKGITDNKIKSIILPLLVDHMTREANYFLKILNNYNSL